jgi:hypothetical protein
MARKSKGARLDLGEPWTSDLADFCAAHYGAPEKNIIRAALDTFIKERLGAETDLRKRFEDARKKRLGAAGGANVRVLPTTK